MPPARSLYRVLGPIVSLAMGLTSMFLVRRGLEFAPIAVAVLLLGWLLAVVLGPWLTARAHDPSTLAPEGSRRSRVLRFLATSVLAGAYQNVLFFLLPIWFASSTWSSVNVIPSLLLAVMALGSCFDAAYTREVLARPMRRAAFSAAVLFAALVCAAPVLVVAPLEATFACSAGASVLVAALATLPIRRLRDRRVGSLVFGAAIGAAALMAWAAPLFPPVPMECTDLATATDVVEREPVGESEVFEAGVARVYAWFAIAAPPRQSEELRFEWFRDGELHGRPFDTTLSGGRRSGFRTYAFVTSPRPGRWRVDLHTRSGQLLARRAFEVTAPSRTPGGQRPR